MNIISKFARLLNGYFFGSDHVGGDAYLFYGFIFWMIVLIVVFAFLNITF